MNTILGTMPMLDREVLGNSLVAWGIALIVTAVVYVGLRTVLRIAIGRLKALAAHTGVRWDDMLVDALRSTKALFLLVVAVGAGAGTLRLDGTVDRVIQSLVVIGLLVQGGLWLSALLTAWLTAYRERELPNDPAGVTTMSAIGFVGKIGLWVVVLLLALDNLGINITALVAGLGIGGIAVALALQTVLSDLFASLSIVLDKPFAIGDFVIVDEHVGSVEHIGLKSTRVRSLWGEQIVFSNTNLLQSRLRNFGRMFERRIVFKLGVTYQTPRARLQQIPTIIREAIEAQEKTRFDRSHFSAFGDFALMFETAYYVVVPDYAVYMDAQQAIYFSIHERFEAEGIEFAYPTQTVFVEPQGKPS